MRAMRSWMELPVDTIRLPDGLLASLLALRAHIVSFWHRQGAESKLGIHYSRKGDGSSKPETNFRLERTNGDPLSFSAL